MSRLLKSLMIMLILIAFNKVLPQTDTVDTGEFEIVLMEVATTFVETTSDNYSLSGFVGRSFAGFSTSENYQINTSLFSSDLLVTDVDGLSELPDEYQLYQNYPNPFNPSTTIEFSVPYDSRVRVEIINILGQIVSVVAESDFRRGLHKIVWNAASNSSGVYILRMIANSNESGKRFVSTRKVVFLK